MGDIDRYYEILEIEFGSSLEEVKEAYKDLAFIWHPDRYANNERLQQKAAHKLTEINDAYQHLLFFLSQAEFVPIEPELPPPPPAPTREILNKKALRHPATKTNVKKGQNRSKATSKRHKEFNKPKKSKAASHRKQTFRSSNFRSNASHLKQSGESGENAPTNQNYANPKPKSKKRLQRYNLGGWRKQRRNFNTPNYSYSIVPWSPLAIAVASYAVTGWMLELFDAPLWMWVLISSADALWAAILVAEGWAAPRVWLMALMLAGAVGGAIAGFQAGGVVAGVAWALAGGSLGAIASLEAEAGAVVGSIAGASVFAVVGLMAGTGSGDLAQVVMEAACGAIAGLTLGLGVQLALKSQVSAIFGGLVGMGIGAIVGTFSGAGVDAIALAFTLAGSKAVWGAWAAIGIIAGVTAKIVAGERAIGCSSGFYTFVLLTVTSGLGLWLGSWLAEIIRF
ncbi:MAG: DnaJ domain-containing protein [Microcoleus sp.]